MNLLHLFLLVAIPATIGFYFGYLVYGGKYDPPQDMCMHCPYNPQALNDEIM